jgi:hypothetical protein
VLVLLPHGYYTWLVREDGVVEYATFGVYLLAAAAGGLLTRRLYRSGEKTAAILFAMFTAATFLIAMEEISWGQRIFHFRTPAEWAEHNRQGETTLHNLLSKHGLHGLYIVIGFCGAFGWLLLPQRLRQRHPTLCDLVVPGRDLFFYFFPVLGIYGYYEFIKPVEEAFGKEPLIAILGRGRHQEPHELMLALGFFLLAWQGLRQAGKVATSNAGESPMPEVVEINRYRPAGAEAEPMNEAISSRKRASDNASR